MAREKNRTEMAMFASFVTKKQKFQLLLVGKVVYTIWFVLCIELVSE